MNGEATDIVGYDFNCVAYEDLRHFELVLLFWFLF